MLLAGSLAACTTDTSDSPAGPTGSPSPGQPSNAQLLAEQWQRFEADLRDRAAAGDFSGAVLVAGDGAPLVRQAYGPADRESGRPNDIDTRFNIGSVGKMFTGVAIGQLVEQGRLAFGDSIGKYLSGFPQDVADAITIDQLLTHTSGLGDFMRNGYPAAAKEARTASDLMPLITREPLLFEPGTQESYSNSGFVVLGAIIEAITKQSYYDYVREHVFKPAGMSSTDWIRPGHAGVNVARGYMRVSADGRPLPPPQPGSAGQSTGALADNSEVVPWGNPSGGAYSTVGDLQRFAEALLGNRLIGAKLTASVLTGRVPIPGAGGAKTGYGFTDGMTNGVRIVGHGGGAPGVAAAIDMYPDLGYVVVILANYDGVLTPVQDQTRQILTGAPPGPGRDTLASTDPAGELDVTGTTREEQGLRARR